MKQQSLAMAAEDQFGFDPYRKPTRRDELLRTMDALGPWVALCVAVRGDCAALSQGWQRTPTHRAAAHAAHHFIQHGFNLADLACEEVLYTTAPVCVAWWALTRAMLKFRRLLNDKQLGAALFDRVGQELQQRGIKDNTGTIVDATIIGAPSSTKNADKARDPQMHQTRKGQQWFSG